MTPAGVINRFGRYLPDLIGPLTIVGLLSTTIVAAAWLPDRYIARFFHDDAFFVVKTAYHLGAGEGSTFDSVNPTNGYHPLNLWILALLSHFVPIIGSSGLKVIFVFNMVMTAFGLAIIDRFARKAGFTTMGRLFSLLGLTSALAFNDFGLEARLLIPVAWTLLLLVHPLLPSEKLPILAVGAAGTAVILTRLDAVVFVLAVGLFVSISLARPASTNLFKGALTKFVSLMLLPSIGVLGYSIYNWLAFSRPMTVSSWLKFGWPITQDINWLYHPGAYGRIGFCLAVSAGFYLIMLYSRRYGFNVNSKYRQEATLQWLLAAANAYSVSYILILVLFLRGDFGSWYVALPLSIAVVTAAYSMTFLLARIADVSIASPRLTGLAQVLLVFLVLVVGITFSFSKIIRGERDNAIAMGLWIRQNLPDDVRIYQVDGSGFTAYFSERSVINGDGLINSWEYQDYLRSGGLVDYLRKYNVEYVIWTKYHGEAEIRVSVNLWTEPPYVLSFSKQPRKIVHFGPFVLLAVDLSTAVVTKQ